MLDSIDYMAYCVNTPAQKGHPMKPTQAIVFALILCSIIGIDLYMQGITQ